MNFNLYLYIYDYSVRKPVPFMPKVCDVLENHKIFWISPYEILIEGESRTSKVPYSDSFFV